ncbi:MAG: glycoside hydrolase family 97 N-terminal domain-containing protein, partial [Bacteroidales bacterium]|nr:glycoside hydrolase family 97 N-terminal domain-containing protein [Bacteroidales bacterium]
MKKILYFIFAAFTGILLMSNTLLAEHYKLLSPDGKIRVEINTGDKLEYAVFYDDMQIIVPSEISMHTEKHGVFGIKPRVKSVNRRSVDQIQIPVVKQKSAEVREQFNEMKILFKGNYSLCFRAYNEGVAYRWESFIKDELIIVSEEANFSFAKNYISWFPEEESMFSHQEREYLQVPLE